jgi:hypothetical protein
LNASWSRPDTVAARGIATKPDSTPRVQTRMDSLSWELYRDALVTVVLWLVLVGLALFGLSMATARARPTVPVGQLACVSSDVSGTTSADRPYDLQACSPTTPQDVKLLRLLP